MTGDKAYRCLLPGDYPSTQAASLGFHLDRYPFPHWPTSRELKSPPQPSTTTSTSTTTSPKPKPSPRPRPASREDWSPVPAHYQGPLDGRDDGAPLHAKQPPADASSGVGGYRRVHSHKSQQHEPLDLSVRPESGSCLADGAPGSLVPVGAPGGGAYANGTPLPPGAGVPRATQSYAEAMAELGAVPAYRPDLLLLPAGNGAHGSEDAFERARRDREGEVRGDGAESETWKMLSKHNGGVQPEERGHRKAELQGPHAPQPEQGPWGGGEQQQTKSPVMGSLEKFPPGPGAEHHLLQQHRSLLSALRGPGGSSSVATNGYGLSSVGEGILETEAAAGEMSTNISIPKSSRAALCCHQVAGK